MKTKATLIVCVSSFLIAGCASHRSDSVWNPEGMRKDVGHVARIGIYDSRAVALTFIKSELYAQVAANLESRGRDSELAELKHQFHAQVLSTAPVDNILAYIKDQLPGIADGAQVDLILSKWDSDRLAIYPQVEQVDITMLLVDTFNPGKEQVKDALATMKLPPVSLEQAERMRHF